MKHFNIKRRQAGFTLVELSVVLVVVGLLFAAVVKGQEVVDSAKSQKLINDIKSTEALIQKFVQIKSRMPGDCDADGLIDFAVDQVNRADTGNTTRADLYDYSTSQKTYASAATVSTENEGCAQINGTAYTTANTQIGANNWLNDLKLAGLVSDSVPNRTFAKQVNEDFLFVGSVTEGTASLTSTDAQYNAIVVQNVPQWMARQVATAINGTDANSNRGRVRQLVRSASPTNATYEPLWSTVNGTADSMRDAMVSVVYYFDRIPATN
ncbi:MAG: prepilin-type N-terminal cleavage/methylation domain-containing protein [Polaromonas sp.]|nr:prepilin-type N-terminal cleavage/methylation domain-containing protein [Polaromonas sp.]